MLGTQKEQAMLQTDVGITKSVIPTALWSKKYIYMPKFKKTNKPSGS